MSYHNGYTNGYGGNRYEDSSQDEASTSAKSQRRPGVYRGYQDNSHLAPSEPEPHQPSFRRRGTDDSTGRLFAAGGRDTNGYDTSRSRERARLDQDHSGLYTSGPGGKQIEGVLDHINESWDVLTRDDCVPVHVALQLMDYSSLGRGNDYQDFQKTNKSLQKALKAIVNEHHQGFNSSIGTFHKIQSSIQASQSRVRSLRDSVLGAKSSLMMTKPELKVLGSSSQKFDDMLSLLGQIESLQLVPEQLDAQISDKHFLAAVDLLQDALRMIRRSDMENIGALTDIRIYFSNQETSLTDILIEELHDHLYLKSPYCQDRWRPYTGATANGGSSASVNGSNSLPNTWGRPLYRFLDSLDAATPMGDDASKSPETDSFAYIHMIIESLNRLGHLDITVDRMEQRLPVELFAIVERTNQEVDVRHAAHTRGQQKTEMGSLQFDLGNRSDRNEVLNDFLWTLYSKFEAIAEGHRAVHEVVAGIVKREGVRQPQSLLRGFKEMWKLYQSEMRSLLHDYLATDANQSSRYGRQPAAEANVFNRSQRERHKRVFKLSEIDPKSADLAADQRDLDHILQASVPGLVSKNQRRSGVSHHIVSATTDGPSAGHKLLVEPNVFNIGSLLPPSLWFLQRLKDIVPQETEIAMSTLTSFLDDFLVNIFQPQLEETVTELCTQSFIELDAFQEDPSWSQHSSKPIFKGTYNFFVLIRSFCKLLDTIPPDLPSTQLIITQLVAYYDRCCEWYKALVKRPQVQVQDNMKYLKTAAAMADAGDVRVLVESMWKGEAIEDLKEDPMQKEIKLLLAKTNEAPPEPFDIISDRRSVTALSLLYTSMQWLASQLLQLRKVVPEKTQMKRDSTKPQRNRQWSLFNDTSLQNEDVAIYLPMTQETVEAFDSILASIRDFGTTALLTLHIDVRLGVIHMLNRTLNASFLLAQPAQDPDPSILSLNADLVSSADTLSTYLPNLAHNFISTGLALLIDTFLVTNASRIAGGMNEHGCGRMQLNILVLCQNLKSIERASEDRSIELERSVRFFDLYMEGADSIVERAKDKGGEGLEGFSLEELKALVELWYKQGTESGQREVQVRSKRELDDKLLGLSEALWDR